MAIIKRSFNLLDNTTLPSLFKTHVRPLLEYSNIVWRPFNRANQLTIERVWRRATKMVQEVRHLSYQDRLKSLKLPSLHYRRRRGDMIAVIVYNVLHGRGPAYRGALQPDHKQRDKRHLWRLVMPRAVTCVRRNACSVKAISDWNSPLSSIVGADSTRSRIGLTPIGDMSSTHPYHTISNTVTHELDWSGHRRPLASQKFLCILKVEYDLFHFIGVGTTFQ